ncbi:hypothetical protein L218DRAFT_1043068 [Marasmius fiardii PR-910]|nr:hypothetical protein L218DRAFT_1043068 [Marasmius fiardii PR-910]
MNTQTGSRKNQNQNGTVAREAELVAAHTMLELHQSPVLHRSGRRERDLKSVNPDHPTGSGHGDGGRDSTPRQTGSGSQHGSSVRNGYHPYVSNPHPHPQSHPHTSSTGAHALSHTHSRSSHGSTATPNHTYTHTFAPTPSTHQIPSADTNPSTGLPNPSSTPRLPHFQNHTRMSHTFHPIPSTHQIPSVNTNPSTGLPNPDPRGSRLSGHVRRFQDPRTMTWTLLHPGDPHRDDPSRSQDDGRGRGTSCTGPESTRYTHDPPLRHAHQPHRYYHDGPPDITNVSMPLGEGRRGESQNGQRQLDFDRDGHLRLDGRGGGRDASGSGSGSGSESRAQTGSIPSVMEEQPKPLAQPQTLKRDPDGTYWCSIARGAPR